jgi:hypothetical protein
MAGTLGRFRIATTGGRSVGNADFLGRPALFYGWASWDSSRDALADVEAFHQAHPEVEVASVAFDVEGPGRAMRYYAAAKGTHLPLIDATFMTRRAWGMTSLPFWILVDAEGAVLDQGTRFTAGAIKKSLGKKARPAKAVKASKPRFEKAEFQLQTAATFLSRARVDDAVKCVRDAESFDPECAMYRPQRLALAHPDRFYKGAIDLKWLGTQA